MSKLLKGAGTLAKFSETTQLEQIYSWKYRVDICYLGFNLSTPPQEMFFLFSL